MISSWFATLGYNFSLTRKRFLVNKQFHTPSYKLVCLQLNMMAWLCEIICIALTFLPCCKQESSNAQDYVESGMIADLEKKKKCAAE